MDTSKHIFQLHGVNAAEVPVLRKKLRRKEMVTFFEKLAPTVIGIEAGPVAKFFRARFVRELRSAEPASTRPKVEVRSSEIPIYNQKLGHTAFSCSSHAGREKFATDPSRTC